MNQLIRRALVAAAALAAPALVPELAAQQQTSFEQIGEVYYAPEKDAMTDADMSFVFAHVRTPDGMRAATLQWHCMEAGLTIAYDWGTFYGGSEQSTVDVQFRFDGTEAQPPAPWAIARSHQAAFMPVEGALAFTQSALATGSVTLRATDTDGDELTDRFTLGGLADALRRLPCITVQ